MYVVSYLVGGIKQIAATAQYNRTDGNPVDDDGEASDLGSD